MSSKLLIILLLCHFSDFTYGFPQGITELPPHIVAEEIEDKLTNKEDDHSIKEEMIPTALPMPLANLMDTESVAHISGSSYKYLSPGLSLFVYGAPYAFLTNGEYTLQDSLVNGYPVYQKSTGGYTFSFYRRGDGKWYLDFNAPGEEWSGTLMYSTSVGTNPWLVKYNSAAVVIPTTAIYILNFPYDDLGTSGLYVFNGEQYEGYPVYQRTADDYTFSIYRKENGKWYLDFNDLSESWSGTLGFTLTASETPLGAEWNQ